VKESEREVVGWSFQPPRRMWLELRKGREGGRTYRRIGVEVERVPSSLNRETSNRNEPPPPAGEEDEGDEGEEGV